MGRILCNWLSQTESVLALNKKLKVNWNWNCHSKRTGICMLVCCPELMSLLDPSSLSKGVNWENHYRLEDWFFKSKNYSMWWWMFCYVMLTALLRSTIIQNSSSYINVNGIFNTLEITHNLMINVYNCTDPILINNEYQNNIFIKKVGNLY